MGDMNCQALFIALPETEDSSMEQLFATASLWLALALLSALLAAHLRLSIALVEICVGVGMAACIGWFDVAEVLALNAEWVRFLASAGALFLTFLAGAELDPDVIRVKLAEVTVVGVVGFLAPFLGCAAIAFYGLCGIGRRARCAAWPCRPHRWPWSMR